MWSLNSRRLPALLLFLTYSALSPLALSAQAAHFPELENRLSQAIKGGDYDPPSQQEVEAAEGFFLELFKNGANADLEAEARRLGMAVETAGPLTIVYEAKDARRGRGFYVFRRDARHDVLLVPHGFTDEMTREIGVHLFNEGQFSAAAWNTVPRRYQRGGRQVDSDLAHLPDTWFTAFARAAAQTWPDGRTLQIHGFEQGKRKSAAGAGADMILSNGTRTPGAALENLQRCLEPGLKRKVLLYSDGIRELGGTTNAQGIALRGLGYGGFIHMEMSNDLRRELRDEAPLREPLLRCLQP